MKKSELRQIIKEELLKEDMWDDIMKSKEYKDVKKELSDFANRVTTEKKYFNKVVPGKSQINSIRKEIEEGYKNYIKASDAYIKYLKKGE